MVLVLLVPHFRTLTSENGPNPTGMGHLRVGEQVLDALQRRFEVGNASNGLFVWIPSTPSLRSGRSTARVTGQVLSRWIWMNGRVSSKQQGPGVSLGVNVSREALLLLCLYLAGAFHRTINHHFCVRAVFRALGRATEGLLGLDPAGATDERDVKVQRDQHISSVKPLHLNIPHKTSKLVQPSRTE